MKGIFLSYSHKDRPQVEPLVEGLQRAGHDVWWDRLIPVSSTYPEYIDLKLSAAGAVIVAWSPQSVASDYVLWEAMKARERGLYVPILLETTELPPEFFRIQAADLTDWGGETSHPEWIRLLDALGCMEAVDPPGDGPTAGKVSPDVGRTRMPSVKGLKKRNPRNPADDS